MPVPIPDDDDDLEDGEGDLGGDDEELQEGPEMTEEGSEGGEGILLSIEDPGYSVRVPGTDPDIYGIAPTSSERMEAGLQDSLDLTDWKMPSLRDYFWYLVVYTFTIALAIQVIYMYREVWAYVLWGGYLVTLLFLVGLIVRSLNYRRGTYSKSFNMSTLDLQQAMEEALDDVRLRIDRVERPRGAFLRPMIAVYIIERTDFTVSLEGRSHLRRKVVRVGRFPDPESHEVGRRFCNALDEAVETQFREKGPRKLFHEDVA